MVGSYEEAVGWGHYILGDLSRGGKAWIWRSGLRNMMRVWKERGGEVDVRIERIRTLVTWSLNRRHFWGVLILLSCSLIYMLGAIACNLTTSEVYELRKEAKHGLSFCVFLFEQSSESSIYRLSRNIRKVSTAYPKPLYSIKIYNKGPIMV